MWEGYSEGGQGEKSRKRKEAARRVRSRRRKKERLDFMRAAGWHEGAGKGSRDGRGIIRKLVRISTHLHLSLLDRFLLVSWILTLLTAGFFLRLPSGRTHSPIPLPPSLPLSVLSEQYFKQNH